MFTQHSYKNQHSVPTSTYVYTHMQNRLKHYFNTGFDRIFNIFLNIKNKIKFFESHPKNIQIQF